MTKTDRDFGRAQAMHADRVIVPFPITLGELARLTRAAQLAGDVERANALLAMTSRRQMQTRYARMAQQAASVEDDPEGW